MIRIVAPPRRRGQSRSFITSYHATACASKTEIRGRWNFRAEQILVGSSRAQSGLEQLRGIARRELRVGCLVGFAGMSDNLAPPRLLGEQHEYTRNLYEHCIYDLVGAVGVDRLVVGLATSGLVAERASR